MKFCIPKPQMAELKKAIDNVSLSKLSKMENNKRIEFFEKVVSPREASRLNKELNRALITKKGSALKQWLKRNVDEKYRAKLDRKFNTVNELEDFIALKVDAWAQQKHNIALTEDELKKFTELGKKLYTAERTVGVDIGGITSEKGLKANTEWATAQKEMFEYAQSITPRSPYRVFTQTLGKANLLFKPASVLINVTGGLLNATQELITRRFATGKVFYDVDSKLISSYVKNNIKLFRKTGIDFSRMVSTDNTVFGLGKMLGEQVSQPKNKYVKAYTDFTFGTLLGLPDTAFSSMSFADSVALQASKFAKGNKAKANEIFEDATRVAPQTKEGIAIRTQAVMDAQTATFTNDSFTSKFSEEFRQVLNKIPGRPGDLIMPFVKTVGNIAELGADYGGIGFVKAIVKTGKAQYKRIKIGANKIDKAEMDSIARDLTRAGLGMSAAFAIASFVDAKDFMGAYDPKRLGIDQLSNSTNNAIRINVAGKDRWVSMDYFGALAPAITGMLYAKKYGKDGKGKAAQYVSSSTIQFLGALPFLPGVETLNTVLTSVTQFSSESTYKYYGKKTMEGIRDMVVNRTIPGLVSDIAKSLDDVQRDTKQEKFILKTPVGDINFDSLAQKIPFWRNNLPVKYDSLGRVMLESSPIESLMFGARVKTARMDEITSEIYRLRDNGYKPNIKDLRFMNSVKVDELREKVGKEKFYEITRKYGEDLAVKIQNEIKGVQRTDNKKPYKDLSDEEKQKRIDDLGQSLYVKTLESNGVKYK